MKQMNPAQYGLNGWHVLFSMIAFFLAVIAVNGVMIYKAVSTFGGDTPDAYRTGLLYNQRIADERRQNELGWAEAITFDNASDILHLTLKDRGGSGVDSLHVTGTIGRPTTDVADRNLVLTAAGDGVYAIKLSNLAEGEWDVSLIASQIDAHDGNSNVVYRSKVRLWKRP